MIKNKDLYCTSEKHKGMKIEPPPNLAPEYSKSFEDTVRPQLEKIYSYNYDKFKYENTEKSENQISGVPETHRVSEHIKIFISKDNFPDGFKKPDIEDINSCLSKIPEKHLKYITNIYFVSYHCKDDAEYKGPPGRCIPITYDIIIFPKAMGRLTKILTHEIGHVIFEKMCNFSIRQEFFNIIQKLCCETLNKINSAEDKYIFKHDQFADSYELYLNRPDIFKNIPLIPSFFEKYIFNL